MYTKEVPECGLYQFNCEEGSVCDLREQMKKDMQENILTDEKTVVVVNGNEKDDPKVGRITESKITPK